MPPNASIAGVSRSVAGVGLILLLALTAGCRQRPEVFLKDYPVIDLLIENGRILDGLGSAPVRGDVAVVGDRIVFVGDAKFSADEMGRRVLRRLDAADRHVVPGFIDLHAHGDPLETPSFENFLAMGVTTVALGQDGSSPDVPVLSEWLARAAAAGTGTNIAMFVGHGTLRKLSAIDMDREPSPASLERMLALLDETLPYTFGLSTGLEYNPGLNAQAAELTALAEVVGRHDRVIMSHLRNEDDDRLEESIAELLEQGRHARVHIAHLKSVYGKGAGRAEEILSILDEARNAGISVTADVYPYTASYTGVAIVFPVWAKTEAQFEQARRERREELAGYLRQRIEQRNGPEAMLLGTAPYTGKTLAELAYGREMSFEDLLIDEIGPHGAQAAYFVMNEDLQARLIESPLIGVSSDGSPTGFHPRGHGAFAKLIEDYAVNRQILTLPEAVRKVTSFAAGILGIDDRGALRPGMKADIVVFDPLSVRARATYTEPLQFAEGFDVVIVNGKIARKDQRLGERLSGRILRPPERPAP